MGFVCFLKLNNLRLTCLIHLNKIISCCYLTLKIMLYVLCRLYIISLWISLANMGKSPGKWFKAVLFGKKSSKSNLSKGKEIKVSIQ